MKALLRFVALGLALFAALGHPRAGGDPAVSSKGIPYNDADLLAAAAVQRGLGDDDVVVQRRLVQNARSLDLSVDQAPADLGDGDPIVTRRLVQQMRLQIEDEARRAEPTDAELSEYFALNADRFGVPATVRLTHAYFSNTRPDAEVDARQFLARATSDQTPGKSDPSLWPSDLPLLSLTELEKIFGAAAPKIVAAPLDAWSGPYRSALGYHVVRVNERHAAKMPAFALVRSAVRLALLNQRAEEHVQRTLARWGSAESVGWASAHR